MGLFDKATLVSYWQKLKDDAKKARGGGKKPPSEAKFEPLIKETETAMKSSKPDLAKIKGKIAAVRIELNKYKATLPLPQEKVLSDGIVKFVKLFDDMEQATELAIKDGREVSTEYAAAKVKFVRMTAILNGYSSEIDALIKVLTDRAQKANIGQKTTVAHVLTCSKAIEPLQKKLEKIQKEYQDTFEKIRRLDNRVDR